MSNQQHVTPKKKFASTVRLDQTEAVDNSFQPGTPFARGSKVLGEIVEQYEQNFDPYAYGDLIKNGLEKKEQLDNMVQKIKEIEDKAKE